MKIMDRDIEVMSWISEQKFMTVDQVRKVFWKDSEGGRKAAYLRLLDLQKAGYLKRSRECIYRNVLYVVAGKGVRLLRAFGRGYGLKELYDVDYSGYKHDVVVTDLRILFHGWGFTDWASERALEQVKVFQRIADGLIYYKGRSFAIEFESAQKSKDRYKDIFLHYELDSRVDEVIYVVETPGLVAKLCDMARNYDKLHFVALDDLLKDQLKATYKGPVVINTNDGQDSDGGVLWDIFSKPKQVGELV